MKKIFLLFIIIVSVYFIFFNNKKDEQLDEPEPVQTKSKTNGIQGNVDTIKPSPAISTVKTAKRPITTLSQRTEVPSTDVESLEYQTETLFRFSNYDATSEDLIEELERLDLKPNQTVNHSSIGISKTIRTEKALKGTRYFHAQFKGDSADNAVVQHMSFEFRPGKDSFTKGVSALNSKFKLPANKKIDKEDFQAWSLDNGYIVWVKKLTKTDLDNDPFNAYTDEDVGTIRLAIEVDIHPASEEEDEHEH